jgi:YjbE family integral membrane protein
MDFASTDFLAALFAIIVIDLVLAGDNAIVIALAARRLPKHLQRRAILWGTAGAIVMRATMTLVVVWLLNIPGLLFVGGAILVWIAYRLLIPEEASGGGHGSSVEGAGTFWGAMKTIVFADMVMGLDNVLAVAGAAHGSYVLVVLGLLISVPIVIWGSTFLLRFVERYPSFVYLGAGVLAWTAVKMMSSEPLVKDALLANGAILPLLYALVVGGVLGAGLVRNHRRVESRIRERVRGLAPARSAGDAAGGAASDGPAAVRVLVPVDRTTNAGHAVRHVIEQFEAGVPIALHLLDVQPAFSRRVAQFAAPHSRDDHHRRESERALRPVRSLLDAAGLPYEVHVQVGRKAEVIAESAKRLACDHIVMGTARRNSLTRMLDASVTHRVLELTPVPVEVVAGRAISPMEKYGVPAGLGGALALFVMAAD